MLNRIHNSQNPYQGDFKRVLCVCSAGLLRSPTVALVLSQDPYNHNTRACGLHDYALVPIDGVLVSWAQEIVVMEKYMADEFWQKYPSCKVPVVVLDIPDSYIYRDPELIGLIKKRYADSEIMRKAQ